METTPGLQPGMELLQSSALSTWLRRHDIVFAICEWRIRVGVGEFPPPVYEEIIITYNNVLRLKIPTCQRTKTTKKKEPCRDFTQGGVL